MTLFKLRLIPGIVQFTCPEATKNYNRAVIDARFNQESSIPQLNEDLTPRQIQMMTTRGVSGLFQYPGRN